MNTLTELQKETLKVLEETKKVMPITAGRIAFTIKLRENRAKEGVNMRSIIHALRVKGYPICANTKGYYYAQTSTELSEYIAELNGRIAKIEQAKNGLDRSYGMVKDVFEEKTKKLF